MSTFNSVESTSYGDVCESKHYNLKQFITAARDYSSTRAEDTASLINRHLQMLSVAIDLSIFDPHTSVVSEFFVSLHELISTLESRSPLTWCCVSVLNVACRNPAARNALIHTYQFLPALSRIIGDQLNLEKKIRLLTVMQELSCGIKISWQIPHLPHLMSTLTRWVENEEEEVVSLSLGVLVNLCYKNLPAIYTLSRCVDIKKFVRICMPMKGAKIEVHVCKLLIVLDYMNGTVPDATFLKLVEVTFKSMVEAFRVGDSILLRHIVEFFLDIKKQNGRTNGIYNFESCDKEVEKLLFVVENNIHRSHAAGDQELDPECMALLFEFLHSLIELKLPCLVNLYPRLIELALKWIQTDLVCSQALAILRTIAVDTDKSNSGMLEPLLTGLPIFVLALDNGEEEIPTNIEHNKRLSAVMQLVRALVQAELIREKVMGALKEGVIQKIFVPLLGNKSPRNRASDADTSSTEAVNMYVNALALVDELVKFNIEWVTLHRNLLQQKQIHMILAQGLYSGSQDIKALILGMASSTLFPTYLIAGAMCEMQHVVQMETPVNNINPHIAESLSYPSMSVAQTEQLEEVIHKLKEACSHNNLLNISTSDVMELYEYKMASLGHAERAAVASAEAASQSCTHFQHRTAQLTAELSRMHQLLFRTQQCHENASKSIEAVTQDNKDLSNRLDAEKGKCKAISSQLALNEKNLLEKDALVECHTKKIKELEEAKAAAEEQLAELKKVVTKLEENLLRMEKHLEKKEELINRGNSNNEHLRMQMTLMEKQLKHTENELSDRSNELVEISQELAEKNQIIDSITKLTTSRHNM